MADEYGGPSVGEKVATATKSDDFLWGTIKASKKKKQEEVVGGGTGKGRRSGIWEDAATWSIKT